MNWFNIDFLQNASITYTPTNFHKTTKEHLAKKYMFFNNLLREYKEELFTYECTSQEEFNFLVASHSKFDTSLSNFMTFIYYADKFEYVNLPDMCDKFIKTYEKSGVPEKFKSVSIAYELYGSSFHTCPPVVKGWNWLKTLKSTDNIYDNFRLLDNVPMFHEHNGITYGKSVLVITAIKDYKKLLRLTNLYCTDIISDKMLELFAFVKDVQDTENHTKQMANLYQLIQLLHDKYPNDPNLDPLVSRIINAFRSPLQLP